LFPNESSLGLSKHARSIRRHQVIQRRLAPPSRPFEQAIGRAFFRSRHRVLPSKSIASIDRKWPRQKESQGRKSEPWKVAARGPSICTRDAKAGTSRDSIEHCFNALPAETASDRRASSAEGSRQLDRSNVGAKRQPLKDAPIAPWARITLHFQAAVPVRPVRDCGFMRIKHHQ